MSSFNLWMDSDKPIMGHRIYGVVTGTVTDNKDPDNLGKIKVKFPWLPTQDESYWAKMVTPMAGKERGIYFLPEVGDEVLVIFENGDIRNPYILGGVWSKDTPPPANNSDGKNNRRLIKSRSGHIITLNDEKGKETIEIVDKSQKNQIVIDTSKNTITITSEKDITLSATQGKIKLEAQSLEIKTSADTKIEASAGVDIKASATMNLKGATINLN